MQPGKNPKTNKRNGFLGPHDKKSSKSLPRGKSFQTLIQPTSQESVQVRLPYEVRTDQTYLTTSFLSIYFLASWDIFSLTLPGLCQRMGWLFFPNTQ